MGLEKMFSNRSIEVLRRLKNAFLKLAYGNNRAILLLVCIRLVNGLPQFQILSSGRDSNLSGMVRESLANLLHYRGAI